MRSAAVPPPPPPRVDPLQGPEASGWTRAEQETLTWTSSSVYVSQPAEVWEVATSVRATVAMTTAGKCHLRRRCEFLLIWREAAA